MTVIVPDMDMPTSCMTCDFLRPHTKKPGWYICFRTGKQTYDMNTEGMEALFAGRDKKCPLFEVKAWEDT